MRIGVALLAWGLWFSTFGYFTRASPAEELPPSVLLSDIQYSTACGPISCFAAARYFGRTDVSLDKMAGLCHWSEGRTTTLKELQEALESLPGLQVQGVRLSPEQLAELLKTKKYAAILTVRRDSNQVNHSVCVFGDDHGGVIAVDYPKIQETWSASRLAADWDGKALLISEMPPPSWYALVLQGSVPGAVVAGCLYLAISPVYRKSSPAQ